MTDAEVEKVARAIHNASCPARTWEEAYILARAAIAAIAAMPDAAPLEEALEREMAISATLLFTREGVFVTVATAEPGVYLDGHGPTIDAAVRAAVANAQEADDE